MPVCTNRVVVRISNTGNTVTQQGVFSEIQNKHYVSQQNVIGWKGYDFLVNTETNNKNKIHICCHCRRVIMCYVPNMGKFKEFSSITLLMLNKKYENIYYLKIIKLQLLLYFAMPLKETTVLYLFIRVLLDTILFLFNTIFPWF